MRAATLGIGATFLLAACGMSHNQASASTSKPKSLKDAQHGRTGVTVSGPSTTFEFPDMKHPGRFLAKVWAKGFKTDAPSSTVYVTLTGVSGTLFQKGVPSAHFTAPEAKGDTAAQQIVATGRVKYTSLINKGTWVEADRVVWSAKTNKGVATGHVVMRYGQSGLTAHTSKLNFDTGLRTVESSSVSGSLP